MWAKQSLAINSGTRGNFSGIGERLSFGGVGAVGFALDAPGDPEIWSKLTPGQQTWIMNTLVKLDGKIRQATGTSCPSFGPSITAAGGCFQAWFNSMYGSQQLQGIKMPLRTDGVFDQDTFWALMKTVGDRSADFPTPFPGTESITTQGGEKKLSKGAMYGLAAAGVTAVGGIIYAATRGKKRSRRR